MHKILVCEFPYSDRTHPDASDWITQTIIEMRDDPRVGPGNIGRWRVSDTPVTMTRNAALAFAEEKGYDFVLMIDNDVSPDYLVGQDETAKPFWKTSFDFALASPHPCIVAAPYVGPPLVEENVYSFRFTNRISENPNPDFQIAGVSRHEAAVATGFERMVALATGLILIDIRAIRKMPHPRFYYEYTDARQTHKASTEDITFTRDAHYLGVPLWINWDSWCAHNKVKRCGKPQLIPDGCVPKFLMERAEQLIAERQAKAAEPTVATAAVDSKPPKPTITLPAGVANRLPDFVKC